MLRGVPVLGTTEEFEAVIAELDGAGRSRGTSSSPRRLSSFESVRRSSA